MTQGSRWSIEFRIVRIFAVSIHCSKPNEQMRKGCAATLLNLAYDPGSESAVAMDATADVTGGNKKRS